MCISTKTNNAVIVIGAGASGLMAASFAQKNGAEKIFIFEKNEKPGKKIYITGKGRCNVTNDCSPDDFFLACTRNSKFLYSAYRHFSAQDMMDFLKENHCPVKVERGKRVFPVSDKASDVTKALVHSLNPSKVEIIFHTAVRSLILKQNRVLGVETENGKTYYADAVIVATGGLSYPQTGSTGDGFTFARNSGHTVSSVFPSLVGFDTADEWPKELQGLSLYNAALVVKRNKRELFHQIGDILFTHYGVSGPLFIELSSFICDQPLEEFDVFIDLKPGLSDGQLEARLIKDFSSRGKTFFSSILKEYVPRRMTETICTQSRIHPETPLAQITAEERSALVHLLKHLPVRLLKTRPFSEAIITRGGVDVKQIHPSTMESKRISGLFFCGEVLDVDAVTGGFNLQIAFSTGALAGEKAAQLSRTGNESE